MPRPGPVSDIADTARINVDVDDLERGGDLPPEAKAPVNCPIFEKIEKPEMAQRRPSQRDEKQQQPAKKRQLERLLKLEHDAAR